MRAKFVRSTLCMGVSECSRKKGALWEDLDVLYYVGAVEIGS